MTPLTLRNIRSPRAADLLTVYAQYGVICHFLLRKEVVNKHDFDGGLGGVSAGIEMFLVQLIMFLWGILRQGRYSVKDSVRCFGKTRSDGTVPRFHVSLSDCSGPEPHRISIGSLGRIFKVGSGSGIPVFVP